MKTSGIKRYKKGLLCEKIAVVWLVLKGYTILKTRYKTGSGTGCAEIDIIARRGNTISFVEVKGRKKIDDGLFAITPAQQIRLRRAAENFLARSAVGCGGRFDVIVVSKFIPYHFKNMF